MSLWGSVEPLREDTRGLRRSGVIYITMKTLSLTSLAPPKDTYSWPVYKLGVISMAMLEQKPVSAPGALEEERLTTLVLHFWKNLLYTNSHWHGLIKNVECLCILNVFWIIFGINKENCFCGRKFKFKGKKLVFRCYLWQAYLNLIEMLI